MTRAIEIVFWMLFGAYTAWLGFPLVPLFRALLHRHWSRRLHLYIAGEGTEGQRARFARHLAGCRRCAREFEEAGQIGALVAQAKGRVTK